MEKAAVMIKEIIKKSSCRESVAPYRVILNTIFPRAGTVISCRTGTQSEGLIKTGGGVGGR